MKATKTTFTVKVEVLSPDSIPALLCQVATILEVEFPGGSLTAEDGDHVEWSAEQKLVEF
jgi:hypothetical protein